MKQSLKEKLNDLNKLIENYDFRKMAKSCFVPNCPNAPINSHTIQKKNIFSYLEEKTEKNYFKVYSLEDKPSISFNDLKLLTFHSHRRKLVELGKNDASTISGFCSEHDKNIFKAIEDERFESSPLKTFLHSLRAYAFDIICTQGLYNISIDLIKQNSTIDDTLNELKTKIPLVTTFLTALPDDYILSETDLVPLKLLQENSILRVLNIDNEFEKINLSNKNGKELKGIFKTYFFQLQKLPQFNPYFNNLNEIVKKQSSYLDMVSSDLITKYNNNDFQSFNYYTHKIKGLYPIAGCFVANASFQHLLDVSKKNVYNPKYTFTIFPNVVGKETIIIFSSMEFNHSKLFFSKINILSNIEMEIFLTNVILTKGTNCFISPRLWNKLTNVEKDLLLKDKSNSDPVYINIESKGLNLFDEKFKE